MNLPSKVFSPFRLAVARVEVRDPASPAAAAKPAGTGAGEKRTGSMAVAKASENQPGLSPRDTLRRAIQAAAEAAVAAEQATAAAARGQAGVDAARAALTPYDDLNAAIAAHHAAAARAGEPASRALPPDLVEARREKSFALQDLADATAAAELLSAEADAATAGLEAARAAVRAAIHSVADAEAAGLAIRLQAVERQAAELRETLGAYSRTRAMDAPRNVPSSILVAVQTDWGEALLSAHAIRGMPSSAPAWLAFRSALAIDADTALGPSA